MANYKLVNADQLDTDLTNLSNAIKTQAGISTSTKLHFSDEMITTVQSIAGGEAQYILSGNWQLKDNFNMNYDIELDENYFGSATENFKFFGVFKGVKYDGVDASFNFGTNSGGPWIKLTVNGEQEYLYAGWSYPVIDTSFLFGNIIGFGINKQIVSQKFYNWIVSNTTSFIGNDHLLTQDILNIGDVGTGSFETPLWTYSHNDANTYTFTILDSEYLILSMDLGILSPELDYTAIPLTDPTSKPFLSCFDNYDSTYTYTHIPSWNTTIKWVIEITCTWITNDSFSIKLNGQYYASADATPEESIPYLYGFTGTIKYLTKEKNVI